MKFLILSALVAVACAAPQQYSTIKQSGQGLPLSGLAGQGLAGSALSGARSLSRDAAAEVTELKYDMPDPQHYAYSLKTSNGIDLAEQAALDSPAGKVQGAYSFVADDGQTYKIEYFADETGYHPAGAHLPVAPEGPAIPAAILRSLEWNAAHPEEEADGQEAAAAFNKATLTKPFRG